MSYLDVKDFKFNNEMLRGFIIDSIDNKKVNISDIQVKFQNNRAIVINLISDNTEIIKYINNEDIKELKGKYYHYFFKATIESKLNIGFHSPFYTFNIIVNLIEFSDTNVFFINSNKQFNISIVSTENMQSFIKRRKLLSLFDFQDLVFSDYQEKYRYLLELNSFIYDTPILIERVYLTKSDDVNILYQSQNIDKNNEKELSEVVHIIRRGHFKSNLSNYLDNFVEFKRSKNTLNLLLKIYLLTDIFDGKIDYHLNDISGFIDLFDGIFYQLGGKKEAQTKICKKCDYKSNFKKDYPLSFKIDFVIKKLESRLNNYGIDKDKNISNILSKFRNMIRHQNDFKEHDLDKIFTFSKGVLRLYLIKHILKMNENDYDINMILEEFNIYSLVKHIYKYKNEEIIVLNTKIDNYNHHVLAENSTYYTILREQVIFKDVLPEEFIYSACKEVKKIYIDEKDKIKRNLIFFGIVIYNDEILKSKNDRYLNNITYDELKINLEID